MEAKIKITTGVMGVLSMEAEGDSYFVSEQTKSLLNYLSDNKGKKNTEEVLPDDIADKLPEVPDIDFPFDDVKEETVVIYDDAGIPSIMRKFSRVTNEELFGGSDKPHPAFIIDNELYDEIYISVYPNCEINGKPYSLPFQKPWTNIRNDDAAKACFSKGAGWHLMTAAEWGLVALTSLKNGTLPHGNTNYGKYHADENEKGVNIDGSGVTLTGSGPATWTHNHQPDGVHDLCGNVWEMVRGLRIRNGKLEAPYNNDAAMDIDLSECGDAWQPIVDCNDKPVYVSVGDGIRFTTEDNISQDYDGSSWEDVEIDCESEKLKALALCHGEDEAYCWIDSSDGEYFPLRGGYWHNGASAGVFDVYLHNPRSYSGSTIGFRSAYYKKH